MLYSNFLKKVQGKKNRTRSVAYFSSQFQLLWIKVKVNGDHAELNASSFTNFVSEGGVDNLQRCSKSSNLKACYASNKINQDQILKLKYAFASKVRHRESITPALSYIQKTLMYSDSADKASLEKPDFQRTWLFRVRETPWKCCQCEKLNARRSSIT